MKKLIMASLLVVIGVSVSGCIASPAALVHDALHCVGLTDLR